MKIQNIQVYTHDSIGLGEYGPTALIFSRQNLAQQARDAEQLANVAKGGYLLKDCTGKPELILIATGSEVEIAVEAAAQLTAEGKQVRVVSMPALLIIGINTWD